MGQFLVGVHLVHISFSFCFLFAIIISFKVHCFFLSDSKRTYADKHMNSLIDLNATKRVPYKFSIDVLSSSTIHWNSGEYSNTSKFLCSNIRIIRKLEYLIA